MSTLQNFSLTLQTPKGVIPDLAGDKREALLAFARFFEALAGGEEKGSPGESALLIIKGAADGAFVDAFGTFAFASAVVTNTALVNAVTFTAIKQRATGTLTAATAIVGTTCVINGSTFTGAAGVVVPGAQTFSIDTGNTETAASLAAQINASVDPLIAGIVTATSASAVVTIRAVTAGTAGNSLTLVGTVTVLAASNTTLLGGIAVANNQFDISPGGTNAQAAADLVRSINATTTAAATLVKACNLSGTIACASVLTGQSVKIGNVVLTAFNGIADRYNSFDMSTSDAATGTALAACINAHPTLSRLVLAVDGGAGTVTLRQKNDGVGLGLSASAATFTLSGAALASGATVLVTAREPGLGGNAITTTATGNITAGGAKMTGGVGGNALTALSFP